MISVAEITVKLLAGTVPNVTALVPVTLVPVMVTVVPSAAGPEDGETAVTFGLETYVNSSVATCRANPLGVVTVMFTVSLGCGPGR